MDVYSSTECFTRKDGSKFNAQVLLVNFKKLVTSDPSLPPELLPLQQDLLHAVVGLYDISLPDLDTDPIYSTLCATGAKTIVVLRSVQDVLQQRRSDSVSRKGKRRSAEVMDSNRTGAVVSDDAVVTAGMDDVSSQFEQLYSCSSSSSEDEEEEEEEESNDESGEDPAQSLSKGREAFLKEAHQRKLLDSTSAASVGIEHRLLACATFSKVSIKPGEVAVQISLIAVRRHIRYCGVGRYLMMNMKDYSMVGQYDVLLCYADHKAINFFHRYGFTDNPIIAHKWRHLTDPWDNSTLMSYIAPFSGPTLSLGINTSTAISNMERHLERWLQEGFSQHYQQLSFMERLRNEIILLHAKHLLSIFFEGMALVMNLAYLEFMLKKAKVQSQEEVIIALTAELDHMSMEKQVLEEEFTAYRKQANQMLQKTSRQQAENWDPNTDD